MSASDDYTELSEFNGEILAELRRRANTSEEQLAEQANLSKGRLRALEACESKATAAEESRLADFFHVPRFTFYRRLPINAIEQVADFRSEKGRRASSATEVLGAIRLARNIQWLLEKLSEDQPSWSQRNYGRLSLNNNPEEAGTNFRKILNISDEQQINIQTSRKFSALLRLKVESMGLSVICFSFLDSTFKGLSLQPRPRIPLILINSFKQQHSSRVFSLIHELCHVLLGQTGISNPYESYSRIEKFCNRFAASLLMPKNLVDGLVNKSPHKDITSNDSVRWLSNKLNVSQEATVIRLQELELVDRKFWERWKGQFNTLPSEIIKRGGSSAQGPNQGLVKLAQYGFYFGKIVPDAVADKELSPLALFQATRLKPNYLKDMQKASEERRLEVENYGRKFIQ